MKPGSAVGALTVLLCCAAALFSGAIEVFLVPLRSGTAFVPIGVLVCAVGNVLLPLLARWAVAAGSASVAGGTTVLCWFIAVAALGMVPRPEGDVVIPAGGGEQWVYLATVAVGLVAGVGTAFGGIPRLVSALRQRRAINP